MTRLEEQDRVATSLVPDIGDDFAMPLDDDGLNDFLSLLFPVPQGPEAPAVATVGMTPTTQPRDIDGVSAELIKSSLLEEVAKVRDAAIAAMVAKVAADNANAEAERKIQRDNEIAAAVKKAREERDAELAEEVAKAIEAGKKAKEDRDAELAEVVAKLRDAAITAMVAVGLAPNWRKAEEKEPLSARR